MRRQREPVPRAQSPWSWLGGILTLGFLAAGTVTAALALWENVDVQRLTRIPGDVRQFPLPDPVIPAAPVAAESTFEATLYRSAATAGFFPEADFYPGILRTWAALLSGAGGEVRTIDTAAEVEAMAGVGLLVAPAAVCLDEAEVRAIRNHAERGGGLVLSWATGARDARCEWRGWAVVQELTGADDVRELERRDALFLTVPGATAVSGGIEPASRIELRWEAQLAVETTGPRAYWSDWALNPVPATGTETVDTAIALRRLPGGGRIVWFGFMEHHAVGDLDKARVRRLLTNGALWGAGVPTAEILPWPGGSRAAFVLAEAVSGEFANAEHLASLARSRNVPATFFTVSRLADANPGLADPLRAAGEVGSQTSDNGTLAGLPRGEQETRLRRSVSEIRSWTGVAPQGLRPPEEAADAGTLEAWHTLGGSYVVGLNEGRTGSPEVHAVENGEIVLLPRAMKDDYNLIIQERRLRPETFTDELLEGLEKLHSLGGLALLMVHSELAGTERYMESLGTVLDFIVADPNWWAATGGEVAEWTLARRDSEVRVTRTNEDRIEIEVRAPANRPLRGGWVELALPEGAAGWAPESEAGPLPYADCGRGIQIAIGDLAPGERRTIVVIYRPEPAFDSAP